MTEPNNTAEEQYVLAVDGEGAICVVVPRCDLHNTLHALMCVCESEWDCCETEGVSEACATLDDDDHWTHPYPDYKPFQWTWTDTEESPITVTRLTMPYALLSQLQPEPPDAELTDKEAIPDGWDWVRGKLQACCPELCISQRDDELAGTPYEVMGWMHVLCSYAQSANRCYLSIAIEQERRAVKAEAEVARLMAESVPPPNETKE